MSESGLTVTTEPEHEHFCNACGQVWKHTDELCVGPRFRSYTCYDPNYDCPMCVGG